MLKEFCRNGHRLSDDNMRIVEDKRGLYRQCIICARENLRRSRLKRFGPTIKPTALERFFKFVREDPETHCWIWIGSRLKSGHGHFRHNGKTMLAHNFALEHIAGRPPIEGLEPDHLCRNPSCVRPDDLEYVTHQVNVLRGKGPTAINAAKVMCLRGHPLSGENLIVQQGRYGTERRCRICQTEKNRRNGRRYQERQRLLEDAN